MSDLYRVGRHQPQNLYRGEQYIGVMFSPADAALVVRTLNDAHAGSSRCTDCGRTARKLTPVHEDINGVSEIAGWLGPGCYRKHLDRLRDAALGGESCFLISVPLGGAR